MKTSHRLVSTLAILNLVLLWKVSAFGAGTGSSPSSQGSPIALVDIGYIFDHHPRFKQQMEALVKDAQSMQRGFVDEEKDIVKQREKLQTFSAGSPEYKKLEEEIARRISDMQVRKQLKQKESREREAKIFYDTYMEISREVARLANQFGLDLVLRFESQEIDPRNPVSVTNGLNRNVIYQRQLDLTSYVLEAINKTAPAGDPPPRSGSGPGTPPPRSGATPTATGPKPSVPR